MDPRHCFENFAVASFVAANIMYTWTRRASYKQARRGGCVAGEMLHRVAQIAVGGKH
jgi:hypothetical protein